ncbi:MAG: bacillithiol system redox-active protein YtxJ [Flavobacteriaceae bacterium]|jgi:bacillithiol system protein YtxJ|nr:bacillithiol system redox-active protein YtxJ [Flavobacteriaceae bacterium]MAY53877.1 bacillithiol system redox-active protein YtxJ [Flavobacteriaceae bacterium]|tara:strand:- start:450 stop:845 length:396 start_codon:yes stop_codon:yes gene_type:complete
MGLFSKFNKTQRDIAKEEIVEVPWHVLSEMQQLDEIAEISKTTPVAIFKHSTRCGISRMVLRNFESGYNLSDDQIKLYFLDLLSHRDISDEVGYRFQVIHQSPQLIVVKNGVAVANASHHSIRAGDLEKFI